ncbi:PARG1-like protein [Mya arenaria]|uniref:PARG1-like protein n=1 Tax=Mya arenaria TaxID=6604 RepID=A0ABY7FZ45_MYAAR|nr:PARG1-like protein [Mya arenaria]
MNTNLDPRAPEGAHINLTEPLSPAAVLDVFFVYTDPSFMSNCFTQIDGLFDKNIDSGKLVLGLVDMQMIAVRHQTIVDINMGFPYQQPTSWENCIFSGLCKFFRKPDHVGELPKFISHTLPAIIDLAFDVEHILPPEDDQREIPRLLCWSIVACGFLCLFPNEERGFGTRLNTINFNRFFAHLPLWSQNAKLQCILHFFDRVHAEKTNASGNIIFTRQEEVRFTVCPELVAAMLFMESMEENEAIVISGFQQYSMTCGYAAGLEFVGDNEDKAEVDERGNLKTTLCAIDASRDDHSRGTKRSATVKHHKQYDDRVLLRDINKAFVEQVPNLALIDEFVENLLSSAMILALPLASRALQAEESGASTFPVNRESSSTNSDTDVVSAVSLVDSIQQRQSSMDHLDVNFREWYNNYRRRSSNLSDLSSRRSSYDCASRRSSNCSARGGYSSEFSSEFEEYYDNFQQQERYKYHTITEEVGSAAVMEFASTLAASLLQAGTQEAAFLCPSPRDFQESLPDENVHGYINDEDNQENNISEDNLVDNTDVEHNISEDDVNKNDSKSNTNFSESSQSDHSIDAKDQSDSSFQESSSYSQTNQANHGKIDPAVQVAEKMVSVGRDSSKGLVDSVASPSKCQQSCDSTVKVVIDSVPIKHSTTTSDNLSHNEREMYSRIADKILLQGLSPGDDTELARSIKMDELASGNDSLTDKRKLFCEPTVPSFGRSSSQSESNSQESDSSCVPNSSVSSGLSSCAKLSSLDKSKLKTSVKNEREFKHTVPVEINQDLQSANIDYDMLGARPKVKESVVPKPKAGKSTSENKQSEVRISNRSFSNSDSNESCGSSFRIPSTSPDTSSSDNSAHHGAIGAKSHMTSHVITAVIPTSPGESNPKSHSKLKSKPCFPFMTGNKKNYDQFANSLSRDLLTNAFLQVQEHRECVSYPRRSSEPMQISNDAALQRLENSINHRNGRRTGKSKTDEDISLMDWEWSQQITTKTSSGFRDPLLSRFAEELMKANVSVPPLQLLGADQVSISSSSQSVCSTMSSFRDPLLASFEEELINNSLKITTSAKTVTSWSKMKDRQMYAVDLYSDLLAKSILASAMVTVEMVNTDWSEQNRVVTWSDKTECVQYSEANLEDDVMEKRDMESCVDPARCSSEYEDALDIPYQYLEQFADVLASKVLINSVAISRREHLSSLRQQYGRPIATGNWGCGAFGGDPHLKSLLQWMAASYAGCPCLLYYTFQNANMEKEVVDLILERGWDVSRLMQVVRRYCITTCEEIEASGAPTRQLFDVILQGEIFPDIILKLGTFVHKDNTHRVFLMINLLIQESL